MISRFVIVGLLLVQATEVFAADCRCKLPDENLFLPASCPAETSSVVPAPAVLPAMSYRSIDVSGFLSLIGKMAGITVCVSSNTSGVIQVTSSKLQPWPILMEEVAKQNGLSISTTAELVYVRGQTK